MIKMQKLSLTILMVRRQRRRLALLAVSMLIFLFCNMFGAHKPDSDNLIDNFLHWNDDDSDVALRKLLGKNVSSNISDVQCELFFNSDSLTKSDYLKYYTRHRVKMHDPPASVDLGSCEGIRHRWKFAESASSPEELDFPIAFARTVFTDYVLLEEMLSVEYQPQNAYCYALDAKSDPTFKRRIRLLAECFPNVIIPTDEYSVYSNGRNVTRSHFSCLKALRNIKTPWKYAILLQNHDVPLKTNREMVEILKIFNGTNDISTTYTMPASINKELNWTFANLQLYRNEKSNPAMMHKIQVDKLPAVQHTKSLVTVELARNAVDFLLDEIDWDRFVTVLENASYGMDEVALSTLNSNLPDMPGGFTPYCLYEKNRSVISIGRYTVWKGNVEQCRSRKFRHFSCIFGVEDLEHLASKEMTQLYLNKFMSTFDYAAVHCWLRHLKIRYMNKTPFIKAHFYRNLPHVRYNRLKTTNIGTSRLKEFHCR